MEQLLRSRVNSRLVTLYQHVLYKEMIDEQVAQGTSGHLKILPHYGIQQKDPFGCGVL